MESSVRIRELTPELGSELTGLDIAQPLSEATVAALRHMLHTRGVLVVRGSCLTPAQSLAFYRHFVSGTERAGGSIQGDALGNNDPNLLTAFASAGGAVQLIGNGSSVKEIGAVAQREPGFWHGDFGTYRMSWDCAACNPTLLHAVAVPTSGHGKLRWGGSELSFRAGSTLFVRGRTLLEALPAELASRCRRVRVRYRTNVLGAQAGHVQASHSGVRSLPEARAPPEGWVLGDAQPIVWRHPVTQAESLQVSASTYGIFEERIGLGCGAAAAASAFAVADHVEDEGSGNWARLSRAESTALLEEIMSYGLTPQNTLCVDYDVGTTVVWDNRLVLHRSTPQQGYLAEGEERLLHRVFVVDAADRRLNSVERRAREAKL